MGDEQALSQRQPGRTSPASMMPSPDSLRIAEPRQDTCEDSVSPSLRKACDKIQQHVFQSPTREQSDASPGPFLSSASEHVDIVDIPFPAVVSSAVDRGIFNSYKQSPETVPCAFALVVEGPESVPTIEKMNYLRVEFFHAAPALWTAEVEFQQDAPNKFALLSALLNKLAKVAKRVSF